MKTKSILLTAASVLASASLAWAQDNAPAPEAPAAPAAVAPAIPPPPTPPVAPVPTVAPALPSPSAPSVGMGGGGGMAIGSSRGGGGGVMLSQPVPPGGGRTSGTFTFVGPKGPDTTLNVVTSSTQDLVDEAPESPEVNAGMMEEEGQLNLDAAMKRYQQTISKFDSRRSATAQAVFRLGECYRKMGRMEEAKVQYARILREFPDQESLVKSSQAYLFGNANRNFNTRLEKIVKRREPTVTGMASTVTTTERSVSSAGVSPEHYGETASADALQSNYNQELALMQKQIAEAQQQIKVGAAPNDAADKLQRELLKLQREKLVADAGLRNFSSPQMVDPTTGLPVVTSAADAKAQSDLELMRREVAKAELESLLKEREADEALAKEDAVNRKLDKPELLASVLGTDTIYMKLKGEYEMARLDASGADAGADEKKKAELALNRLHYYVSDICLPQLSEMSKYAQRKLNFSKEIAKTIKKHLNEMESAQDPFQHAPSAMPAIEHAPDAAPNSSTPSPTPNETH